MAYRKKKNFLEIDEVFTDSHSNLGHGREGFEGMLETPISKKIFLLCGFVILSVGVIFLLRIGFLQIIQGQAFVDRSENNYLKFVDVTPERGFIYDRYGGPIAGNEFVDFAKNPVLVRNYPEKGFLHTLGFVSESDSALPSGVSGIEAFYDDVLQGKFGINIEEVNASGNVVGYGTSVKGETGRGIITSIDSGLQNQLGEVISDTAKSYGFSGGAGVFLDVKNGAVLALSSVPEFDPNIFTQKPSQEEINSLIYDPGKPFFNRAVLGLYPPGSIVKLAVAAGALNENIISSQKQIFSSGALTLPNPYNPDNPNIFLDWKAHGWVDMTRAIAVSSNVYFYTIGGGFQDQAGLGVANINKYFSLFGLGEYTNIDLPGEKNGLLPDPNAEYRSREWNIGDTYHLSIGQGDLLVTPIQMAVYASTIASYGNVISPRIAQAILNENKEVIEKFPVVIKRSNVLSKEVFDIIHDGMRKAVTDGTSQGLSGLPIKVAAKTGTAEIGNTGRVHSWSIGFFPYDDPKIAFAILMENGSETNLVGATFVARKIIQWISENGIL